jgi:hypothetical protein
MKFAVSIDICFTGPSGYDKTWVANQYAGKMIENFPEIEWCDVEVHEVGKSEGDKGFSRNPPPLRRCYDCKHCFIGSDQKHCYCKYQHQIMEITDSCGYFVLDKYNI